MVRNRRFWVVLPLVALLGCEQPTTQSDQPGDAVQAAKSSLSIGYASGESATSVTQDLTLSTSEGNGVSVSWSSDNPAVTKLGKVTRPAAGNSDVSVQLTATLTKGGASDSKMFTVIVKALGVTYTVYYDANGGAGSLSDPIHYGANQSAAVLPNQFTLPGYSFSRWDTHQGGDGTPYFPNDSILVTGDLTLYAQWAVNHYTVTFDSQGGTTVSSQSVAFGDQVTQPTNPTKTGSSFGGWYKEKACVSPWSFADDTVASTQTLYAKWIPNSLTVSFQTGVGTTVSFSPSSVSINLGDSVTVSPTVGLVGADWTWYLDGVTVSSQSTLSLTPAEVGFSTITLVFTSGGVLCSGTISMVVSQ